ncbi:hypothetical protein C2S51_018021 [Perilla frutescens var. frutescens]|nr:hypothetical protein C2S51_018021 [Perilla frutescens var. frutescens]
MKDCSGERDISLGPWGYNTGKNWSYRPESGGIKHIIVRYAGLVDSLIFKGDCDGDYSTKFGGDGGERTAKIDIDFPSEFLTGISGTHGSFWSYGHNICSLRFHTNKTEYGPFGSETGTPFSVNAKGPWGGDGGRDWDDGVFSAVKGVHVRLRSDTGVVSAVRFSYETGDGSDFLSPFHGSYCVEEMQRKTILFGEKDEFLIGVEGFIGALEGKVGVNVIRSITFVTNKAKYGPLGAEIGTYFSSLIFGGGCNRKVVGFYGRSGAYLDAIGLHTLYF